MTAYARDYMVKQGFEYCETPLMIRSKIVDGVMSFEEKEAMMYKIEGEDLYLIGTSEHPLIGMFADRAFDINELPVRITGFSPCFRKEVGAHGIEEKGFFRVHQFNKQEMIVICEPEDSYKWYDKMLQTSIEIFKALEIPFRVLECCSGDLADLKAKGYEPLALRYFFLQAHYRSQQNFTWEALESSKIALNNLREKIFHWEEFKERKLEKKDRKEAREEYLLPTDVASVIVQLLKIPKDIFIPEIIIYPKVYLTK